MITLQKQQTVGPWTLVFTEYEKEEIRPFSYCMIFVFHLCTTALNILNCNGFSETINKSINDADHHCLVITKWLTIPISN